ncbi:MAG TPA: vitamin B12-dependent ribonucleotide reductase [Candidatus Limnocylindrales bacterium]|nr:vitamin B12-dependent ribonucleotide reductase [Candidatus Limnocylindrales bacterium]
MLKTMKNREVPSISTKTRGLKIKRFYTTPEVHPFEEVEWELRVASFTDEKGETIFEQREVEVPKFWSQTATNVVIRKYFYGALGTPRRERSVKSLINRVARTITDWGLKDGYFTSCEDAETFYHELCHILVHQKAAFNSPVWFNVGIEEHPQCSGSFINSVEDTLESVLDLIKTEGILFKYGSGTGTNFSTLRSSKEKLSGGGKSSGPVSFMRGCDTMAGIIKSGGRTGRAAKMAILNIDHPDILEFIDCKANEEKKAWALIEAGYNGEFNVSGGAYDTVAFQNANHSVRVTDDFMWAVLQDKKWQTRAVTTGEVVDTYSARDLMKRIVDSAYICGDPGLQFDTTINDWHTCPASGRIQASNSCSEFMFLDNSACILGSLNLMKFRHEGSWDVAGFCHVVSIMTIAMEILVGNSGYPTQTIQGNSQKFRPLGLGYANLGALLMSEGLPYDSDAGRAYAGAITALMSGQAYKTSAMIARELGPFQEYAVNREPMLKVIKKHISYLAKIDRLEISRSLIEVAEQVWEDAYRMGQRYGYRNAQVTLLAPTGTIGFYMDCDTTGVEPDISLVKYKKLAGGGLIKIVNRTVPEALKKLGYSTEQIHAIVEYIDQNDTIEGAPGLKPEHLAVFDCAFKPSKGTRSIHYSGHLKMLGAVQPFLSGGVSKTINMPQEATPEDIWQVYMEAWKMGLKAVAVYRDGCKRTQPLSTSVS